MNIKKTFVLISLICIINFIYANEIVTIQGFKDSAVGKKIQINNDNTYNLRSTDNKYVAFIINGSELYITDKLYKVVCKISWDDQVANLPDSDSMYLIGWSSDGDKLWFGSVTPSSFSYLAYVSMLKNEIRYYSNQTGIEHFLYDECFDTDTGILFYSDWIRSYEIPEFPVEDLKEYHLYKYDIINGKIELLDVQTGRKFSIQKYENRIIQYMKGKEIKYYKY